MRLDRLQVSADLLSESKGSWIAFAHFFVGGHCFSLQPDSRYFHFGFSPPEAIANVALAVNEAMKSGQFEIDVEASQKTGKAT